MDYTVQHGDTWKKVSSKFGSFVVEKPEKTLIPSQIVTLDLLCGCSERSTTDVVTYKIESGDTLYTICSQFKADVNETAKLNRLANPNLVFPGDVIFIPGPGKRETTCTWAFKSLPLPQDKDTIVRKKSKASFINKSEIKGFNYAQNGGLSDHLHKPEVRSLLLGLHVFRLLLMQLKVLSIYECTKPYYVHNDEKTSNSLLDADFRAKL